MTRFALVAAAFAAVGASTGAQTPGPRFEVASIRINRDASELPTLLRPVLLPGGRVMMRGQTLSDVIVAGYGIRQNELVGARTN